MTTWPWAQAASQRAEANYKEAHLDYTRLVKVNQTRPNLVAQQDIDSAEAKDNAAAADLAAARADVKKFSTLASYTRITAPFDGVITKRYADSGSLIQDRDIVRDPNRASRAALENSRLRLDFPVSASYAENIVVGDPVEILLDGHARPIAGIISRFSRRIAMETRTMTTEVEVANPSLKLIPGMYATVTVKLQRRSHVLAIPVEVVSGTTHPTVYVVNDRRKSRSGRWQLGLETPTKFEVLTGLREGERVMIGNRGQVHIGEKVLASAIGLFASQ